MIYKNNSTGAVLALERQRLGDPEDEPRAIRRCSWCDSGIYEEDLEAAFIKHATSKLSSAEDLTSIQTLGFRGEALSSIAAVSRIKLTSRKATSETGVTVTVENGKITSKQYVSANVGTKIEIRDLFYNTPARKKFMKAPAREAVDISKFVAKSV